MSNHTLRFESKEMICGLLADSAPHTADINGWRVLETFRPNVHDSIQRGLGSYRVILEKPITSLEEVWAGQRQAYRIAEELDFAWCYVCGHPMVALRVVLESCDAFEGWTGNTKDVVLAIQKGKGGLVGEPFVTAGPGWTWLPFLPLQRAIQVRNAYLAATPAIQDLIELHIQSYKSAGGCLFLLAKALELVRAFFGGSSRKERNTRLQQEMARIGIEPELTQSIEWLFQMANERYDVRHVWDDRQPGVARHPRMAPDERRDYQFNADLVIRAFVCDRLGAELNEQVYLLFNLTPDEIQLLQREVEH